MTWRGWQHEGGSTGCRVVYNFGPKDDVVAAVALNRAVNASEDQIGKPVAALIEAARQ